MKDLSIKFNPLYLHTADYTLIIKYPVCIYYLFRITYDITTRALIKSYRHEVDQ